MQTITDYQKFIIANKKNAAIAASLGFFVGITLFYLMLKKPCGCKDKKESKDDE